MSRTLLSLFGLATLALSQPTLAADDAPPKGTATVMAFWSIQCAPCVENLLALQDAGSDEFTVLAINTDPRHYAERLPTFLASRGVTLSAIGDPEGRIRDRLSAEEGDVMILEAGGGLTTCATDFGAMSPEALIASIAGRGSLAAR